MSELAATICKKTSSREVCERLLVQSHDKTRFLGQLDARCITHVKNLEKEHENIKFQNLTFMQAPNNSIFLTKTALFLDN